MGAARRIRDDLSAIALRALARRERDGRAAARMYAIAHALEEISRVKAARLAGMAHFAIRSLMHEAALQADEDPDRLSFLHAVRVVRRKLAAFGALPPSSEEGIS